MKGEREEKLITLMDMVGKNPQMNINASKLI